MHHCIPNLGLGSSFFFWTGSDGEVYMKHNGCGGDAEKVKPGGVCPQKRPKRGDGICVSRLAENLTDVAETSGQIKIPGEGGGIFERDGRWYLMQVRGLTLSPRLAQSRPATPTLIRSRVYFAPWSLGCH